MALVRPHLGEKDSAAPDFSVAQVDRKTSLPYVAGGTSRAEAFLDLWCERHKSCGSLPCRSLRVTQVARKPSSPDGASGTGRSEAFLAGACG